jgi:hypothetical protein
MSGFRFSLDRVLSWRQTQLTLAEADFERSRSSLQSIEAEIADLFRRDRAMTESLRTAQSLSASGMADLRSFREWVIREEKTLRSRFEQCRTRTEMLSTIVTETRRKVRLMERLKERRLEIHDIAFNRELEQMAAESVISAWCRGR